MRCCLIFHIINDVSLVVYEIYFKKYGSVRHRDGCTVAVEMYGGVFRDVDQQGRSSVIVSTIMSLSTRISISWPPNIPAKEPTETLVLTFPSNHFIDLRPLKSSNDLDWGMAGHQINTKTPQGTKSTPPPDPAPFPINAVL